MFAPLEYTASPYGTHVELSTGETVTVATRERPKLWFNSKREKTHVDS
eukprot:SAG25_NODE_10154_length_344_cov_1.036735_1_plen_48_part_00